ncbi:hypothetical protein FHR32_000581 [Streptosporangium album]|uniref:Uncharacterized protein n=1 Tax=Streptosporangium album TaxID=47479 RepID=A0A7W7RQF2_9ACTN|nr:hypothetical protein [Streptosporangium album]
MRDPLEATGRVDVGDSPPGVDRAAVAERVRGYEETARRRVEDFAATLLLRSSKAVDELAA